uniref:hypothetical protein n=1 Tax=Pseudomonas aeruginosa TaxID=287 RepID=UPI003F74AD9F
MLGGGAQCRYGDLAYVDAWDALLAVEESHGPTGVMHRIACAEVALAGRFADADHAGAPWQLGACSYLPLGEGRLLLSRVEAGGGQLFLRPTACATRRWSNTWWRSTTAPRRNASR